MHVHSTTPALAPAHRRGGSECVAYPARVTSALEQLRSLDRGVERVGADEADVAALEAALGVRLPADYRAFLRWMGRDEDGVWCGSECLIDDIVNNTKSLPELLVENGLAGALPERYVCVFSHQGYIAVWFEAPTDAADPPAFIFNEGQLELGIQTGKTIMQVFLDDYRALQGMAPHAAR